MKTSEVCKKMGVTRKMLRIYEEEGLVVPERGENDYRDYNQDNLVEIQIILIMKSLGFALKDIKAVLDNNDNYDDLLYSFYVQLNGINLKFKELLKIKNGLTVALNELLNSEEKNIELNSAILNCYSHAGREVMYDTILNKWNFDEMAANYVERYLNEDDEYKEAIKDTRKIIREFETDISIADVGAGTAQLWKGMQEYKNLTLFDKSLKMVLAARENVPWGKIMVNDILYIDEYSIEKFDLVVSTFMLHHIDYAEHFEAIMNLFGMCRNNGTVLIVDRSFQNKQEQMAYKKAYEASGDEVGLNTISTECYLRVDEMNRLLGYLRCDYEIIRFNDRMTGFKIIKKPLDLAP